MTASLTCKETCPCHISGGKNSVGTIKSLPTSRDPLPAYNAVSETPTKVKHLLAEPEGGPSEL